MSLFGLREHSEILLLNEEDEALLSRQEMGEKNLVALRTALSKVIHKMKWNKTEEQKVKLLFEKRGETVCVLRVTFSKSSDLSVWKYYIKTEVFENTKDKPVAFRDYHIAIRSSEVKITSGMKITLGYEGHKLGTALLQASDKIVEHFLKIVNGNEVNGKVVEMELEDDAQAQNNERFGRGGWTTILAERMGFNSRGRSESKFLYKRYR